MDFCRQQWRLCGVFCAWVFFMLLSECYLTIGIGATCFIIFNAKCLNEYCHGWTYSCSVTKMSECRRLFSTCSSAAWQDCSKFYACVLVFSRLWPFWVQLFIQHAGGAECKKINIIVFFYFSFVLFCKVRRTLRTSIDFPCTFFVASVFP